MPELSLTKLGLGLNTKLLEGSSKGFSFSISGVRLSRLTVLLFLECDGLDLACFGIVRVPGGIGPSRSGKLAFWFFASLDSLVLLNRTLLFLCGVSAPELVGLLGFALLSALGSSEDISWYPWP